MAGSWTLTPSTMGGPLIYFFFNLTPDTPCCYCVVFDMGPTTTNWRMFAFSFRPRSIHNPRMGRIKKELFDIVEVFCDPTI